ncbi:MAG TPA: hypothetical protein VKR61_08395 [Bryobacteraceae bacterium]|nr:hypothetical protein [Bryobacteraceae bacterium]
MAIFDRFGSKSKTPKAFVETNVQFTEDESKAITTKMEQFAGIANAGADKGETYVHPKMKDAMTAKALAGYSEDLMCQVRHSPDERSAALIDKAIKAQMKAYTIHQLPVYLFQTAEILEYRDDMALAKEFFRRFLEAQNDFVPNTVDTFFLSQADIPKLIATAKEKVR